MIKYKRILLNVLWSLFSSLISTGILQLIVHPILARIFSDAEYGDILFVIGILNVIILTTGNALGDIRLTEDDKYKKEEITGDFNNLLSISSALITLVLLIFTIYTQEKFTINVLVYWILISIVGILGVLHSYLNAMFRLKLIFKQLLQVSILSSIGYFVGAIFSYFTKMWIFPFLFGYAITVTYQAKLTQFYSEPFVWTKYRNNTLKKYSMLSFSYLIKSSMTYADRFIIVPILGPGLLSVYTVAATFGKLATIAIQPVANVALGYYAQKDFEMTPKKFWITNFVTLSAGGIIYIMALLLSSPFIAIMYPAYIDSASQYIALANISSVLTAVCAMIQPAILKYSNVKWQIYIQMGYGMLIIGLSLMLIEPFGLTGFCYASIVANVVKLFIMFLIGDRGVRRINKINAY